jgi:hypothetical protein
MPREEMLTRPKGVILLRQDFLPLKGAKPGIARLEEKRRNLI